MGSSIAALFIVILSYHDKQNLTEFNKVYNIIKRVGGWKQTSISLRAALGQLACHNLKEEGRLLRA